MAFNSIIISGLALAGKSTLVKRLSEAYNWPVHYIGGIWLEKWKKLYPDEEISFEDYWRKTTLEDNLEMERLSREIVYRGRVICDGRYAVNHASNSLLVFITADIDKRV